MGLILSQNAFKDFFLVSHSQHQSKLIQALCLDLCYSRIEIYQSCLLENTINTFNKCHCISIRYISNYDIFQGAVVQKIKPSNFYVDLKYCQNILLSHSFFFKKKTSIRKVSTIKTLMLKQCSKFRTKNEAQKKTSELF